MAELVADCPRCGANQITFEVKSHVVVIEQRYQWQNWYEAFSVCRKCHLSTVFLLSDNVDSDWRKSHEVGLLKVPGALNNFCDVEDYVSIKDRASEAPPEHVPEKIAASFREGATCFTVRCFNAAATMFRLCVDQITWPMLPETAVGLTHDVRRSLGKRLAWLFQNSLLPVDLRDLSTCIKEDGNDGAHAGTLSKEDAEDVMEFTVLLLERLCTEPERLRLAQERRDARRATN